MMKRKEVHAKLRGLTTSDSSEEDKAAEETAGKKTRRRKDAEKWREEDRQHVVTEAMNGIET
jgi:hypothetical protein